MAYSQLASQLAYVGGDPNKKRKAYTPATGQQQDKAKVAAPMQPVNQPGQATIPKPQAPKNYVVAPPVQRPVVEMAQPTNTAPAAKQAPIPNTAQQPAQPPVALNAGSMPPPAGFNPSMTQGQDWWRNLPGYQPQWGTTAKGIEGAVNSLDVNRIPQIQQTGYRDLLTQGIQYLLQQQQGGGQTPPPGTPPGPGPLPVPKLGGASEFFPMELGGGTEASRGPREALNQWIELFGGEGNVKNEVKLGLLNMLMNQQDRDAALGDRDTAVNTMQGSLAAGQNDPLRGLLQQNAMSGLQNAFNPNYGEQVLTGAREDANRRIAQARDAMTADYADRGLGGSEISGSMLNADIQNRALRDQTLRELQIQLMEQQQGQQGNALQQAMSAYGLGQDTDWRSRQAIADLFAGTVRQPVDMSGLIGLHSGLRRPLPEAESDSGTDWGGIIGSVAGLLPGLGSLGSLFK